MNFEYRPFSLENTNLARFSEMYKLCLNANVGIEYFRWKYADNPAGKMLGYVACHGENICGFYGVIPEVYTLNGNPVTIYQSMDTMTHPD